MTAGSEDKVRILVVDDHPVVRQGLVAVLSGAPGFTVVAEAGDARSAATAFARHRPDVVLLDLNLPDLPGPQAIAALRAVDGRARILVLSSFASAAEVRAAVEAGVLGYLVKDAAVDELLRAVSRVSQGLSSFSAAATAHLTGVIEPDALTPKELEVLQLLARGLDNAEIAGALDVSVGTVKTHVAAVLRKLGARDRTQAVLLALRRGLVRLDAGPDGTADA